MIWVVLVLILLWSSGLLFIMRTFITASISSLVSYLPHLGLVLKCYRSRNLCISFKLPVSLNVDFQSMSLYFLNLINISSASPFSFFYFINLCILSFLLMVWVWKSCLSFQGIIPLLSLYNFLHFYLINCNPNFDYLFPSTVCGFEWSCFSKTSKP